MELSKKKLGPALEKLFDGYSTPDELLQIDLLEIDIGKQRWQPSGADFVEAVVSAIEEQLKSTNRKGRAEIKRKPVAQSVFEEWVHFLENGSFPPSTTRPEHTYYQANIPGILKRNPSSKKELIELLGDQPRTLERLLKQHPESFLVTLFAALTESTNSRIDAYKQESQRLVEAAGSSTEMSYQPVAIQPFWKWIFGNLKTNAPRGIDEKELIVGYLAHWGHIQKQKFKEGKSSLRLTLRKILQESPGSFPLLVGIRKQLEVTLLSEEKDSHITRPGRETESSYSTKEPGSRSAKDKEDVESSRKIKVEGRSEKAVPKPTQEPKKFDPKDSTNKNTNQKEKEIRNEQVTPREKRAKALKKSQDNPEAENNSESPELSLTDESTLYRELPIENPVIGPGKKEIAQRDIPVGKKAPEYSDGSFWYINHAGVVLLHTFLPVYFDKCGLTRDRQFIDGAAQERAAQLLLYLATAQEETPEYDMVLAKFLCGMPLETPIYGRLDLRETERSESIKLLQSAIDHWGKLKKTSPDGLRIGFLQREGKLEKRAQGWYLTVEQRSVDVLLNYLPWNLRMVKLPWMEELLRVEWE